MQDISENVAHHAAAPLNANDLEKHCLTCRRRRVKCDATQPKCRRCKSDNIACRGYNRQLKIILFHPTDSLKLTARRTASGPTARRCQTKSLSIYSLPQNGEDLAVIDAIQSYNKHVVRRVSPAHHPFKRQQIPEGIDWHTMPRVLQHLLIVTTRSSQAIKNRTDPTLRQDICHYRGLSLHELKQQLPAAVTDFYGLALGCILLLMAADMHPSAEESWAWHFQAARRIIDLRGGLNVCLCDIPNLQVPLLNYMIVDILTATTCKSTHLFTDNASIRTHSEYLAVIPEWEEDILASSYPCPHIILQSIVRTNILRSSRQAWQVLYMLPANSDQQGILDEFSKIRETIESFDAQSWTIQVLQRGKTLPQRAEDCPSAANVSAFTSLTLCYKSAAFLYLLLSFTSSQGEPLPQTVHYAKQVLDEQSSLIFIASDRSDEDGPLHTQLWKFLTWPLMISVYACVGWDIGLDIEDANTELDRLERKATTFGMERLLIAIKYIRNIWLQKSSNAQFPWTWDDGFSSRATFAL